MSLPRQQGSCFRVRSSAQHLSSLSTTTSTTSPMHTCYVSVSDHRRNPQDHLRAHRWTRLRGGLSQSKCRTESALRTLATLACTCNMFREVAQDVLWREIPDIFVLVRYLLPRETVREYRASEHTLYLTSTATDATWDRLDKFIPRIRSIGRRLPYLDVERCHLDGYTVLEPLEAYLDRNHGGSFPNLTDVVFQYHCTTEKLAWAEVGAISSS
ncbi:hypothetical protein L226DRAFT_222042 [Lentinus tigrinus ALCF2SS1-7]|uniref:uncharacterized protein n=1 Tax=Lentinus tigrinus ALCF2SS1-7 TaxID=1328758 RepID=UPI00116622B5|nr:hypothetical protein L226DRAFT_222042 [Lentinus tigrinus ALCF2SS1-7]